MKPWLLKEHIKALDDIHYGLNALVNDSEDLVKTLYVKEGVWRDSVHWKMGRIIDDIASHKRFLQKVYDILPKEPPSKDKQVKESQFFSIISELEGKIEKLNERIRLLESNIEEKKPLGPILIEKTEKKRLKTTLDVVKIPKIENLTPEVIVKKRGRPKKS